MVPVKSFMVPNEKFVKVDRDTTVRRAAEMMRECGIGSVLCHDRRRDYRYFDRYRFSEKGCRRWGTIQNTLQLRRLCPLPSSR